MKNINIILIVILLSICGSTFAQISGPTNVCAGSTYSYSYTGAGSCFINFSVTGGVFTSNGNNSSYYAYSDGYTPITFSVKFSNSGYYDINYFNCGGSYISYPVFVNAYSIGITPTSSTISLGSSVTLNKNGAANSWQWTCNKSNCGLNSTTSSSVIATPTTTTVYTIQATQSFSGVTCSATASATVIVNAVPITGNSICCDQSFCGIGDPTVLGQQSGTTLTGGINPYSYQWQSSIDGTTWTNLATTSTYDPPSITQTTFYRRIVNPGSSQSISNISTMSVIPSTVNLNPTSYYLDDATIKASQVVNVLGNINTSGAIVTVKAGQQVVVKPPAILATTLVTRGSIILTTGTCLNGNMRMEEQDESIETNESYTKLQEENGRIFPNPITSGNLNFGRTVSNYTLMNSTGAVMQQGANAEKLDVTGLSKGMYMLKLDDKIEKVIVE